MHINICRTLKTLLFNINFSLAVSSPSNPPVLFKEEKKLQKKKKKTAVEMKK